MRDGGIGSFDVEQVGPRLARAGACRDCIAITFASLAGGMNLAGDWGILERTVADDGGEAFPARGSLDGIIGALGTGVIGALRVLGFAVNLKIDFDRTVAWLVGTTGLMPAADASDVRLLGAGRREARDTFADVLREARDSADVSEMETRDEL